MAEASEKKRSGGRTTRISGACVACRSRKQKCSGDKPQCIQCSINDVECEWPQPQKRGPPKNYTAKLESRLFETENLLAGLLSKVSEEQLEAGLQVVSRQKQGNFGLSADVDPVEYERKTRSKLADWDEYPLDSLDNIARWLRDRSMRLNTEGGSSEIRSPARIEEAEGTAGTPENSHDIEGAKMPMRAVPGGLILRDAAPSGYSERMAPASDSGDVPIQEDLNRTQRQIDQSEDAYIW